MSIRTWNLWRIKGDARPNDCQNHQETVFALNSTFEVAGHRTQKWKLDFFWRFFSGPRDANGVKMCRVLLLFQPAHLILLIYHWKLTNFEGKKSQFFLRKIFCKIMDNKLESLLHRQFWRSEKGRSALRWKWPNFSL